MARLAGNQARAPTAVGAGGPLEKMVDDHFASLPPPGDRHAAAAWTT